MALVLAIATSQIHDAVSKAGNVLEQVRSSMRTVGVRKSSGQVLLDGVDIRQLRWLRSQIALHSFKQNSTVLDDYRAEKIFEACGKIVIVTPLKYCTQLVAGAWIRLPIRHLILNFAASAASDVELKNSLNSLNFFRHGRGSVCQLDSTPDSASLRNLSSSQSWCHRCTRMAREEETGRTAPTGEKSQRDKEVSSYSSVAPSKYRRTLISSCSTRIIRKGKQSKTNLTFVYPLSFAEG
ncbi:hypothetical protein AXG93_3719s1490 [Marchantia polymorpha subsp. ruderalis]|uniref:Uncharacterized protein n=1 Tax=Marchantia polymorpha subsp. ruderalis TaxID=1480154 RepID=A0A176VM94_MARPO|nr:hypothetical protein AXG93_3719s1490 [Marchantia polymorpha subsp. ruderalis]